MLKTKKRWQQLLSVATLVGIGCAGTQAGTNTLDFNSDPLATGLYQELGNSAGQGTGGWRADGGASGAKGDGYVAIADAATYLRFGMLFKDLEAGLVVKAFTFECDLRIGGGPQPPADGFSINYIRVNDPIFAWLDANPGGDPLDVGPGVLAGDTGEHALPEEGTRTGLSIGFDTWQNGNLVDANNVAVPSYNDVAGISVRVDGMPIVQFPVPMSSGNIYTPGMPWHDGWAAAWLGADYHYDPHPYENLATNDPNYLLSMQTGARGTNEVDGTVLPVPQPPIDDPTWGDWVKNLKWEHFKVQLTEDAKIHVWWKGQEITPPAGLQTTFAPSAGRILFCGRTGGSSEVTHVDNIRLVTIPSDVAVIGSPQPLITGFTIGVSDSGPSIFDANAAGAIVSLKLDGTAITATSTSKDTNGITTLTFSEPTKPLVPGSTHTVSLSIKDVRGIAISKDVSFTGMNYKSLDPAWAATGVDTTKLGFTLRFGQADLVNRLGTSVGADVNSGVAIAAAERILHGDLGPNTADLTLYTGAGKTYAETKVINYNAASDGVNVGFYPDDGTVAGGKAAPNLPGLPGIASRESGNDDCAMEIVTYIEFPKQGSYRLIFNSDDGFRTTVAPNPLEQLNSTIVSVLDNGRGAADSVDWVYVGTPGIYPFRTIWVQGGGGANMEWAAINVDGVRALINDSTAPGALKAYRVNNGAEPAAVSFVDPPRATGRAVLPFEPIVVEITDGATAVSAIKLNLNGTEVTPTITKSGKVSKVTYVPAPVLPQGNNTLVVSFADGAKTYSGTLAFTATGGVTVPASMALNAADVDKTKEGFIIKTWQVAMTNNGATSRMGTPNSTWAGEAFVHSFYGWPNRADLTAFTGPGGSYVETGTINYNGPTGGTVGIMPDDLGMPGINGNAELPDGGIDDYALEIRTVLDLQPGVYNMGVNSDDGFRLIVGDGKEAYAFPVVAGEYNGGRGASDWDYTRFSVRITKAGLYPFRLVYEEGGGGNNVEWFVLDKPWSPISVDKTLVNDTGNGGIKAYQYPINSTGPTYVKSFSPARSSWDSAASRGHAGPDATVGAVLVDGSTPVDAATVALKVNGTAVTPTVTKTGGQTTIAYKPAAGFAMGSSNTVDLTFTDRTISWYFIVGLPATPTFWIEAADYDYNGGQTKPEASVMPYAGGAYAGLAGVAGTDYDGPFDSDNAYYRYPNTQRVPVSLATDYDRGSGEVVVDYRIGWMGGNHWFNYTRTIPAGKYNVYAALSNGDTGNMGGALEEVNGGVVTVLGAWSGVGTAGWGNSALLPLKDAATTNTVVTLDLSGTKTLRYHDRNGDWEYMLFVPAQAAGPQFSSIKANADGTITIVWTGGGTLQTAASLTSPIAWQDVVGATSPHTFRPTATQLFGRIKQ